MQNSSSSLLRYLQEYQKSVVHSIRIYMHSAHKLAKNYSWKKGIFPFSACYVYVVVEIKEYSWIQIILVSVLMFSAG